MSRAVVFTLLLGLGTSCATVPPQVGESGPTLADSAQEKAYKQALAADTVQQQVYDVFDTRAFAAATYQSMAFREARTRRMGAFQVQPAPVVEQNLATEREEHGKFHEVFFGVHLNNSKYDDFDRKNSIWRIALVTPQGEATPTSVERVGRSNLNMRALYPYMDQFWVAYRVRFAKEGVLATTGKATFRVASTLGKADFEFKLD